MERLSTQPAARETGREVERYRTGWTSVDQIVAFLSDARAYPEKASSVQVIETHKSWVFLTDRHAHKLKKPIRYNSIDFRSLSARCEDCTAEVALNRRLAGDVYLGVERITRGDDGRLTIGGDGELVDCLVKMTRLPADRMLSHLIGQGQVRESDIRSVATKLARFYRDSPPVLDDAGEYHRQLSDEIALNFDALSLPGRGLDMRCIEQLHDVQLRFIDDQFEMLRTRVAEGRIVDGHGDLRAEHICVLPEPVIFDCLEFDARLRRVDPIDELAFLALECERLGDPSIGPILFDVYVEVTGDAIDPRLVAFYTVYRACMWARLAIWRTRDLEATAWRKWTERAAAYLRIAGRHDESLRM
jgi:uncharacterized protein